MRCHSALHDDEIAKIWKGFIPFSHIDGMLGWGCATDDNDPSGFGASVGWH